MEMNRRPMTKKGSSQYFTATAMKAHRKNFINATMMRGGYRL